MVGRAALGNPWIFRELNGGPPPTRDERRALILRHFDEHLAMFDDAGAACAASASTLLWYAHGLRGAARSGSRPRGLRVRTACARRSSASSARPSPTTEELTRNRPTCQFREALPALVVRAGLFARARAASTQSEVSLGEVTCGETECPVYWLAGLR